MKLNENAFGVAVALVTAAFTALFSLLGPFGWHMGGQYMHGMYAGTAMWFWGAILGILLFSLLGYLAGFGFAWTYNKLEKSK